MELDQDLADQICSERGLLISLTLYNKPPHFLGNPEKQKQKPGVSWVIKYKYTN